MRLGFLLRRAPFIVAAIVSTASIGACARGAYYDDPVFSDRHRWDSREDAAYRRWETERRIEHIEYSRRVVEEQRTYWTWRHSHPD
jgi:hypothetical protein